MARIAILTVLGVFGVSAAWAGIGAVGNPHAPKPAKEDAAPAAAPAAAPQTTNAAVAQPIEPKPLVEIAFDRNYVNYEPSLRQGITAAEKSRVGIMYRVVSYLPASSGSRVQDERQNERAETNLRSVVGALHQQGIPKSRILVMMKAGEADHDTVKIFVE